jgi:ABC-type sulfate transport system substrate-binding protein
MCALLGFLRTLTRKQENESFIRQMIVQKNFRNHNVITKNAEKASCTLIKTQIGVILLLFYFYEKISVLFFQEKSIVYFLF